MFDCPFGLRLGVWTLIAAQVVTSGCASALPPPSSYVTQSGHAFGSRFSVVPHVLADDQPIQFVGLTSEERKAFEEHSESFDENRRQRIERRKIAQLGPRNTPENMIEECVIRALIIFSPVCIVIVPVALIAANTFEGRRAARREPYLPSLPSDRELSGINEKIRQHLTAAAIAERVSTGLQAQGQTRSENRFPRLVIRAESAKFWSNRTIELRFDVRAQTADGETSSPTEHRYHLGYDGDDRKLVRGLREAEDRLAISILYIYGYGPHPAYVPHRDF
jgi:hypothetical protein